MSVWTTRVRLMEGLDASKGLQGVKVKTVVKERLEAGEEERQSTRQKEVIRITVDHGCKPRLS